MTHSTLSHIVYFAGTSRTSYNGGDSIRKKTVVNYLKIIRKYKNRFGASEGHLS